MRMWLLLLMPGLLPLLGNGPSVRHVTVYQEPGRFAGWPANHGVWSWGDEIVVGFRSAPYLASRTRHAVDPAKPQDEWQARSLDGGETWKIEKPPELKRPEHGGPDMVESPGGVDFRHPDFAMMVRSSGPGPRFYYSLDRCRSWKGPFKLPLMGQKGIDARTDYLIEGKRQAAVLLTAHKSNGREGRVMFTRTRDGGRTFEFVSWLGPEPDGFAIMPSSVRFSPDRILTAIRRKEAPDVNWIETYETKDNGASWKLLGKVADTGARSGNPPSMIRLRDGRLVLTYGYRSEPYGMRARISGNEGASWGPEIVLRKDGGGWDLGYPRTVERRDGKIVTIYYYNEDLDKERTIQATIWEPPATGAR